MDLNNFYKTTGKNLVDLYRRLKCPICLDIIENVRELRCKHIFCKNCIDLYGEGKGKIVCPLCKKEVPKRLLPNRDAAFDNICLFTKKLFDELKEHNIDDSSLFVSIKALEEHVNVGDEPESVQIIPQSSEENDVIPCTVKHEENQKSKKTKQNVGTYPKPSKFKSAEKCKKLMIKKLDAKVDKSLPTHSNVLTKSNELKKQSKPVTRRKYMIQAPSPQDNKSRILQWLHDTRNIFERFSQTQNNVTEKDVLFDIDMPSVSQVGQKRSNRNPTGRKNSETERVYSKPRRAHSVKNLDEKGSKSLKRHSLECSTPSNLKQYQNSNEIESIENQLIINLIEDEVLDAIDKKVSEEKNMTKRPLRTSNRINESDSNLNNSKIMRMVENEFLDQLDNDCDKGRMKNHKGKKILKIDNDKNLKSSWRSISSFKKSIKKCKGPKKLNISLQSTQKHNKKTSQEDMKGFHEMIISNNSVIKSKTVDFQKMEDYFSKVIPEMIKNNFPSSSQEISGENEQQTNFEISKIPEDCCINLQEQSFHQKKDIELDHSSDRSGSDIYMYHTQPLSKGVIDASCNKIDCAFEFAKKLETLLISERQEIIHNKEAFSSTFQIIKNIHEKLNLNKTVKHAIDTSSQTSDIKKGSKIFTEKEIQTDVFSLDGFHITPTAAFKSFSYEDKGTQTEFFCVNCPHIVNENLPRNDIGISMPTDILNLRTEDKASHAPNEKLNTLGQTKASQKNSQFDKIEDKNNILKSKHGLSFYSSRNVGTHSLPEKGEKRKLGRSYLSENNKKNLSQQHNMRGEPIDSEIKFEKILKSNNKFESYIINSEEVLPSHSETSYIKNNHTIENPITDPFLKSKKESSNISKESSITDYPGVLNLNEDNSVNCDQKMKPGISQSTSATNNSNVIIKDKENLDTNYPKIDLTPDSIIMYSLTSTKSKVNRKLMFEKAIKDRNELEKTLKRVHTGISNLESEEEVSNKVMCNRFLQEDLSIEFESENIKCSQYPDQNDNVTQETKGSSDKRVSLSYGDILEKNNYFHDSEETKPQKEVEHTQTDALLSYCDKLIAKANHQILSDEPFPSHEHSNHLSQNGKKESTVAEKGDEPLELLKNKEEETQEQFDKIKTQELMKYYDDLIEKANQLLDDMNDKELRVETTKKISYGSSQIPTTSNVFNEFEKINKDFNNEKEIISQDNLDRCIVPTKKSEKSKESQADDEFFYQNLDKLDSVVENVSTNKNENIKNKYSESLFETYKYVNPNQKSSGIEKNNLHGIAENNRFIAPSENDDSSTRCTTKRKTSDSDNERSAKKIKILQNLELNKQIEPDDNKGRNLSSSEDEIFSDVDVVETTPQKPKHSNILERLGCSQALNRSSRTSPNGLEGNSIPLLTIDVVPPPPGFEDEDEYRVKQKLSEFQPATQRESENIIPNSLSPERIEMMSHKKPSKSAKSNSKNLDALDVPKYFEQFTDMSPICDAKTNLNVIEVVHRSTFSPLTILPKSAPLASPLTSTPKQKSILNYVTQNTKKPLNEKTESLSQLSNSARSKPCIAFTRLNRMEVTAIHSLCSRDLASYQDKFGPRITHMIVATDKNNCLKDHTIKFISAVAAGLWVLNFKWIQECLKQNKIVEEESYEVLDVSGVPSPRISRLSRLTNPLFKGFKFYIQGPFAQTSVQEVEAVITLSSGIIVPSIKDFQNDENYICVIIAEDSETEDLEKYQSWLDTYKFVTVDINWLSLSVSRYKVLSLKPYLLCSLDSLIGLRYPQDLLVDVPSSFTQRNTLYD